MANHRMLKVGSLTDTQITVFANRGAEVLKCKGSSISQMKNVTFPAGTVHHMLCNSAKLDIHIRFRNVN